MWNAISALLAIMVISFVLKRYFVNANIVSRISLALLIFREDFRAGRKKTPLSGKKKTGTRIIIIIF